MATVTTTSSGYYSLGFLLGDLTLENSSEVSTSGEHDSTSYSGTYTGSFRSTLSGEITGTVTGYSFGYRSTDFITIDGLNLNAMSIFNLVGTRNLDGLAAILFAGNDVFNVQNYQGAYGRGQNVDALGGNDVIYGSRDEDTLTGGSGRDTLFGASGEDILHGGNGNDPLYGEAGQDSLFGESGDDSLYGGWENDRLLGGAGSDVLDGSLGNDRLSGGVGADILKGGLGADVFRFTSVNVSTFAQSGRDIIEDYSRVEGDQIVLSDIDSNTKLQGNQEFVFVGTDAFHKVAGELRYSVNASGSVIFGDVNGDGRADFAIAVNNVSLLSAGAFLL